MKRILFLTLLLVSLATSAFAISLSELQNSPQFLKTDETSDDTYYLNQDSIKILRYSPPYSTLEYTIYIVSYSNKAIVEINTVANYNYDRSVNYILDNVDTSTLPKYNIRDELTEILIQEKDKDNGLSLTVTDNGFYDLNGNLLLPPSNDPPRVMKSSFAGPAYNTASSAFKKVYSIYF